MNNKGKKILEFVDDYTVFDLETTGISTAYDEIIEIAAVKVRNGEVIDTYSTLVNPGRHIPSAASNVNGIYDHMVSGMPMMSDIIGEFRDFIGGDVLVGHNIHTFDMLFIYRDLERYTDYSLPNNYVDTLALAKMYYPDMRHRRLGDMADKLGISSEGAHRALADVLMNQKVYEAMKRDAVNIKIDIEICPQCGNTMVKRSGKFGLFMGCSGYPTCRYTRNC